MPTLQGKRVQAKTATTKSPVFGQYSGLFLMKIHLRDNASSGVLDLMKKQGLQFDDIFHRGRTFS
jgi:hypothetical protein